MSSQRITVADVRKHLKTSAAHTRPHRYYRVLTERFGWDEERIVDVFAFDNDSDQGLMREAWAAVTLKQPALAVAS